MPDHCGVGLKPCRYTPDLYYANFGPSYWRIVVRDREDGATAVVGPHYATRQELLADLERFATDYGLTGGGE